MPKKVVSKQSVTKRVTPTAYARSRNRHLSAVQKAITAGFIVKGKDGLIEEEQADRDWLSREDTRPKKAAPDAMSGEESTDLNKARVMSEVYRAKKAKLEFERESAELVSLADVNRWVSSMIQKAREELLRIGPELQDELAEERSPAAIGRRIDSRVRSALANLKEYAEREALAAA